MERINGYQGGKGWWEELEDGDWQIYTTDAIYKITDEKILCVTGSSTY